jgi:hemoglobin-like flavoprotein
MTPDQIALVQQSFAQVKPDADLVAVMFYDRLFALNPRLRPMFPAEMGEQRRKLMTMLATAVNGLRKLDALVPAVRELGRRHQSYGVRPDHYTDVGAALIETLRAGLGDAFTPELEAAWAAAYGLLAGAMQSGAEVQSAIHPDEEVLSSVTL